MSLPRAFKKAASRGHGAGRKLVLSHLARRRLRALGFTDDKHDWMAHNIGRELGSANHEALEPCAERVTASSGFELVCSYNWVVPAGGRRGPGPGPGQSQSKSPSPSPSQSQSQSPEQRRLRDHQPMNPQAQAPGSGSRAPPRPPRRRPQIFVPGQAFRLVPRRLPLQTLYKSRGRSFRDANAAMLPRWPFEPMFRAVEIMRPKFKFDNVDLVINRNSLSRLLRLVKGSCKDAFRLNLAMVQNTLIATPLWERVSDSPRLNYGRICEQTFTQPAIGLEESGSHHRAICYQLGSLRCVVLCEVDTAISGLRPSMGIRNWVMKNLGPQQVAAVRITTRPQAKEERSLFSGLMRDSSKPPPQPDYKPSSEVLKRGTGTLSSLTAELVTGTKPGAMVRRGKLSQMWLGRTPYSIESLHTKNVFTHVKMEYLWPRLMKYEERSQHELQKLVTVIKTVKELTANAKDRQSIAVCTKNDKTLRVFEPQHTQKPPVPNGLQLRLWSKHWRGLKGVSPPQAGAAEAPTIKTPMNAQIGPKTELGGGDLAQLEATT